MVLAGDERGVAGEQVGAFAVQVGDDQLHLGSVDVIAEHEPLQPSQVLAAALGRDGGRGRLQRREGDALACRRGRPAVQRFEGHERRLRGHVDVRADEHLPDAATERRDQRRLHLHGLDDRDDVPGLDLVAGGDGDRDHNPRGEVAHEPAVVARDPVRHAVDLDEQVRALDRGQRAVSAPAQLEAPLMRAEPLDVHLDRLAVDRHAVAARRDLSHRELVGLPAVAQIDGAREACAGLRTSAPGEGVEAGAVGRRLRLRQHGRRLQQGDVGVAHGHDLAAEVQPVQPGRVDVAGADLRTAEQLEQEALVRGPSVDDDHRIGEGAAQAGEGLVAVVAPGNQLGDHRVELGGDDVALGDARVHAHARPGGQPQQDHSAGSGQEAERGVLGVEPRLDRVPDGRRRLALQPPPGGDVKLQLDEVEPRDRLGHRVLDLQPRVDLHEGEAAFRGLVEELHRAGVLVSGAQREPPRRLHDLAPLLGRETRAGGLLDDLLVASLVGAVAQAGRPHAALAVGDDLHLDVPCRGDELLQQQRPVAEGLKRLGSARSRRRPGARRAPRRAGCRGRRRRLRP